MLLHRRVWHADRVHDRIDLISLFTDASPNCGHELQGTVASVLRKDGSSYHITFPGSTLCYGQADLVSK
eukprot:5986486-Pyramimonas_sp.AAC.1